MNKEDAIKTLRELWRETNDTWYEEVYNMAIEALSAPSGDLISRQWLLDVYGDYIEDNGEPKYYVPLEVVRQNIKDAPSADVVSREAHYDAVANRITDMEERGFVSVVRCKDCRWWQDDYMGTWCGRVSGIHFTNADDYCSWGERRGEVM